MRPERLFPGPLLEMFLSMGWLFLKRCYLLLGSTLCMPLSHNRLHLLSHSGQDTEVRYLISAITNFQGTRLSPGGTKVYTTKTLYIVPLLYSNPQTPNLGVTDLSCLNPSQSLKMTCFVGSAVEGIVALWTEGRVIPGRGKRKNHISLPFPFFLNSSNIWSK